jgi:ATP-dependent helicase/nuclease subunit B
VRISFLLGAAGSGKTFRCLSEIRDELLAHPEGAPLVFLAPKQSTYQLERQLLEEDGLTGYSRLQIVSFERVASFVFQQLKVAPPRFISEQGRTMVLRALLTEMHGDLTIFRGAARRLGFAEELSKQIRELHNHGLSVAKVRRIASQITAGHSAREKLLDLALVQERYAAWMAQQGLEDGDALLTSAKELLEKTEAGALEFGGIWFDGFAQLTPQELDFLVAALRFSKGATLAFCVDSETATSSKISAGFLVSQTVGRCRSSIEQRYGKESIKVEALARDPQRSRFKGCAALTHLEKSWRSTEKFEGQLLGAVRLVEAADPETEAVFAAREIVQHVKRGGRFREVALLLRDLQNDYPHVLRRVFGRYQIPFFLDHRESVAHHPLAELTRGALRTLAYNFQHHDWFATLKCGLMQVGAEDLDELENEALARGWSGGVWRTGFSVPKDAILEQRMNRLRERAIQPLAQFATGLGTRPRAEQLAAAIRGLWKTLGVEQQLESWRQEAASAALHATVWEQMARWLEDLELAFAGQQLTLVEWLPIIEAGLRNLTVGVVPPVLDQVLIGTVDRSRNPDLKVLYVLGVNERVFPASPGRDTLLTEDDRDALCATGCTLGETPAWRMAGEQFYGYIACTRPRERLVLSYARSGLNRTQLNPSRFVAQVQRMFPMLEVEKVEPARTLEEIVHECELAALGCFSAGGTATLKIAAVEENLDPEVAHRLYGDELSISVSALERFAACPFKFFVEYGLRVKERKEFLLDAREQGSFQHAVLEIFHRELKAAGLQWRNVTPAEARTRVGRIADELIPTFRDGLMAKSEQNRFTAENYKAGLQELLSVLVEWCTTNRFDPIEVEFGFGAGSELPTWRLELENGRAMLLYGRVDRVDLLRVNEQEALCVVMDYKSGLKAPHRTLLHHGVQQQLPAYLLALTRMKEVAAHFKVEKLAAAGCFLLPLRATAERKKSRREALQDANNSKRGRYMHEGLFDVSHLNLFDAKAPGETSGQFNYRLTKAGEPWSNSFNALKPREFSALLERSEELMREFGRRIYEGDIAIRPYKHGTTTPCDRCDYQPVCRFDPWMQKYNVLRAAVKAEVDK